MKKRIEKLYELQKKNLLYSGWIQEISLQQHVQELQGEIDEALEEVQNGNWEQFADEIGDVLWDLLGILAKTEHDGHLTTVDVLDHIYKKFTERKPFLLEERFVSKEDELVLWNKIKEKQKNEQKNQTTPTL